MICHPGHNNIYYYYLKSQMPKCRHDIFDKASFVNRSWICTIYPSDINANGYIHLHRRGKGK